MCLCFCIKMYVCKFENSVLYKLSCKNVGVVLFELFWYLKWLRVFEVWLKLVVVDMLGVFD